MSGLDSAVVARALFLYAADSKVFFCLKNMASSHHILSCLLVSTSLPPSLSIQDPVINVETPVTSDVPYLPPPSSRQHQSTAAATQPAFHGAAFARDRDLSTYQANMSRFECCRRRVNN